MKVKLRDVRLAFPELFRAVAISNDTNAEPRFSAAFPIKPGSENAKALAAAVDAVAVEKWKDKAQAILTELRAKGRVGYQERPLSKDGEVYDGFEDMYSLNASNKARPTILNSDKTPLVEADGKPYSGCYVNVVLDCWAQDNQFGKRVNFTLTGVQFFRDGDAFGGGRPASVDDFDDVTDGAGAEDFS